MQNIHWIFSKYLRPPPPKSVYCNFSNHENISYHCFGASQMCQSNYHIIGDDVFHEHEQTQQKGIRFFHYCQNSSTVIKQNIQQAKTVECSFSQKLLKKSLMKQNFWKCPVLLPPPQNVHWLFSMNLFVCSPLIVHCLPIKQ